MKQIGFEVTFMSDVVLQATSNTEGRNVQLDFIPGSNFLGIAASAYDQYENSFHLFHSGKVRFSDASLIHDGKMTYKVPLSYFHEKLDDSTILNHHHITDFGQYKQLKQMRNGFITIDKELIALEYYYSQKSAYDKEKRRSKESQMYGYSAMPQGLVWEFSVMYDETVSQKDIDLMIQTLVGRKRLGKSKSAQYGQVEIKQKVPLRDNIEDMSIQGEVILYANSRLALIDECGYPTYDPRYLIEGLREEQIVWEKCQIRTSSFSPYNVARQTKDYERTVINKGSVIVLNDLSTDQLEALKKGVGMFLSEGFGELLINPVFVQESGFALAKVNEQRAKHKVRQIDVVSNDLTVQFLIHRNNSRIEMLKLAQNVQQFIERHQTLYPTKMNPQWGTIRSLCVNATDEDIVAKVTTYITSGIAKEKWEGKKSQVLLDAIEQEKQKVVFTKLLAIQMPKNKEAADVK